MVRMQESLYERIKSNARKQNRSVNSYIVNILENATPSAVPKLKEKDFRPSKELRSLGSVLNGATESMEELDDKAKYILSK